MQPDAAQDHVNLPQTDGAAAFGIILHGWHAVLVTIARMVVVLAFGLVLPSVLLFQAYASSAGITSSFHHHSDLKSTIENMPSRVQGLGATNDYILMTAFFLETVNQRTLANKQRMKIAVIHIGFAVISLGLLLVLLGIDVGGIAFAGTHTDSGMRLSIKIASTGVLVFITGALMASAGGLLHNEYRTAAVPSFVIGTADTTTGGAEPKTENTGEALAALLAKCSAAHSTDSEKLACYQQVTALLSQK